MERTFNAPVEKLWSLWTTKEGLEAWWGPPEYRVDVHSLDLRVGGELVYDLVAVTPKQQAYLASVGREAAHESRGVYVELEPLRRLKLRFMVDFLEGVEPYPYHIAVDFLPGKLVVTTDPHHEPEMTRLAAVALEQELEKLAAVLER